MRTFYADVEFINNKGNHAVKYDDKVTIHFSAQDEQDAIEGVLRWIENRQRTILEFEKVFNVKVGMTVVHTIDATGYLASTRMGAFLHWNTDLLSGFSFKEQINSFKEQVKHCKK